LLPVSSVMRAYAASPLGEQCVLSGGDDYELCFTAAAVHHAEIADISARLGLPLTCIGKIVAGRGCIVRDAAGNQLNPGNGGYEHFR
jgi:thiamine-monophosphate kinase